MSEPVLGEIRVFSYTAPPDGWAACDGQLLPISQNQELFSLLGTTYGGDGQTTFALPNLKGRVPIHVGNGHMLGQAGGERSHALTVGELPAHVHIARASTANANTPNPGNAALAAALNLYSTPTNLTPLSTPTVAEAGGNQPHPNMQPFLGLNFCIALTGVAPSPN